ncbi:superoxide dismutase family protein [Aquincola sp. MAHUQ-54]|uniref:Superoxide dismutase [Cu-Zn] n=1 Tax=Aquincola agrisoli TaxID=3119538 RepID=A0AAW9QNS0_9BURK
MSLSNVPARLGGLSAAAVCAAVLMSACAMPGGSKPAATAKLAPTQGNTTAGTVDFYKDGEHVVVQARITGLKPGSEHGFHVHEKGDCSSPDGMSAGGHFNPSGQPHGGEGGARHAGDMPNLKADAAGQADVRLHLMGVTIGSGAADIVGKAVIVHANPDDYRSQPAGNAGPRLACGVIAAR